MGDLESTWDDRKNYSKTNLSKPNRTKLSEHTGGWSNFQLSVENNPGFHWFCFSALCDWS